MEDFNQSVERLQRLEKVGLNLAIDDFRSGYPSLTHLRHLPIDTLKIDRSFVHNLGKEREGAQVKSILSLAESLGAAVVAEGVEEVRARSLSHRDGMPTWSGFLFLETVGRGPGFRLP